MEKINAKVGEVFRVVEYDLIRFSDCDGGVRVVFKDIVFRSDYGSNNNLSESTILERMEKEILPELEKLLGAENILPFETDLISMDGSRKHGKMSSRISLPTFDFYRENREIFEKYKLDSWWWLATPWETSEYTNDNWIACVSPLGYFGNVGFNIGLGVRPFLIFSPSIFVS